MERSYLPTIKGYIPRPRVDALIREGLDYARVLVVAGPGYGKTLSVAHYLKTADVRLVWMRASSTRTKAADFWVDVVKAVRREMPQYAEKLEELGFPDSPGSFAQLWDMAAEAAEDGERLVFVVDNYERILDEEITGFLNDLTESELPNFTMFILCNVMLPFAKVLPATGQFRISDDDLAFTKEEAGEMYRQYGADVTPDVLERACKVTGSWPLGLRLICEASPDNPEAFSSRSSIQMTADLFEQHYYRNYPKDVQVQLVLFSLLPQFSMEMVLREGGTPKDDFAHILMQNPFVSYDYGSSLFSFQRMYHDFLRQRQNLLSREARTDAMDFAGRWFIEHGMMHEAMDCFWEAGDYGGFLEAVALLPKVRKSADITNRVLLRLEQIPRSYADEHPDVDYSIAFMYLNAAKTERARALFLQVAQRLEAAPPTEETRLLLGDIYATLADIATYLNEDTGLAWIKKACEQVPNGSRSHSPELLALGNNSVFFLPGPAAGQTEYMVEYFFEYAQYADKVKNGCGHGYEYLFAGEAAFYREDMDHALTMFNSAMMKAHSTAQHDIICNALWSLGRIELYYGSHKNAMALLGEIETYINENALVGLYELRDCAIAYFSIRLGDMDRVPAWFAQPMTGPEATPITMARKHLTSAMFLHMRGESARSLAVLLQLESLLEGQGRWLERLSLYTLKAQHYMAAGQPDAFLQAFRKAYDMVYENNLILALSNVGREMVAMLDYLKKQDTAGYDMEWLGKVHEDAASIAKRLQMMRLAYRSGDGSRRSSISLTKREDETLHFLAQGLTQKEIGKLMGISENAVKKHISKIYFKLGAVNRADAIHIATMNGLVDAFNR